MKSVKFIKAVRTKDGKTSRYVFAVGAQLYVVIKDFGPDAPSTLLSVKVWSTFGSSLDKVMSFWTTNVEFTPTRSKIDLAERQIQAVINQL